MFPGLNLNMNFTLWQSTFNQWVAFALGKDGFLYPPMMIVVVLGIVGVILYTFRDTIGILFGATASFKRNVRVQFEGANTVWGSEKETHEFIDQMGYQKIESKAQSSDYVLTDEEGNEQSKIRVSSWSSD